jgi:hypothetical protein
MGPTHCQRLKGLARLHENRVVAQRRFIASDDEIDIGLLLPQSADQFYNASRARAAATAIALMPEEANAEAITTSVARLLNEPDFAARACDVRVEMAAMPCAQEG